MAARLIYVNGSGSDTQASGCGPATAIYGSNASTDGTTTIDLSLDSPNLSGVQQYDLIWVDTATGSQFGVVQSVDNVAKTVTVGTALNLGSTQSWAIGGKRATLQSLDNFIVNVSDSNWMIKVETDQTLTQQFPSTSPVNYNVYTIIGDNGVDSSKIKLTASHSSYYCFTALRATCQFWNFEFDCPNNNAWLFRDYYGAVVLYDCVVGTRGGSNSPSGIMRRVSRYAQISFYRCQCFPTRYSVEGAWIGNTIIDSYFETTTAITTDVLFWTKGSGAHTARNSIFKHAGIVFHQNDYNRTWDINLTNCIIDGASYGCRAWSTGGGRVNIENTIFSNCGQAIQPSTSVNYDYYPRPFYGTDPSEKTHFRRNNCFYNNTTDGVTLNATEVSLDPQYGDASAGNYAVGNTALLVGGNQRDFNGYSAPEAIGPFRSSATGGTSYTPAASAKFTRLE